MMSTLVAIAKYRWAGRASTALLFRHERKNVVRGVVLGPEKCALLLKSLPRFLSTSVMTAASAAAAAEGA